MKKILVVEDEKSLLNALNLKLKDLDLEILSSDNVASALQIIKQNAISLVVLDIMLPGGENGFDLLEKIKKDETNKLIPVIILTNLDTEQEVAKRIGANEYLIKSDNTIDQVKDLIKKYVSLQ